MFQEEQLHSILKEHFLNNNLKVALRKSEDILDNKMKIICQLNEELARLNSKKPPKQTDASTMTLIAGSYFDKQKDSVSTQNSNP